MNRCQNCSQEVSTKAKFCSDRCRKAYGRKSDTKSDKSQPGQPNPDKLTKTDQSFYDRQVRDEMGDYYHFTADRYSRTCRQCTTPFTTSLKSLHYCSYEDYSAATSL